MENIKRDIYLKRLIDREQNGLVKIITGIRRCGKSYLLNNLFYDYLKRKGVDDSHIIKISLDDDENEDLLLPKALSRHIKSMITDNNLYYIFLNIKDFFKKIIIVKDDIKRKRDENGIVTMSIYDFLLDEESVEY